MEKQETEKRPAFLIAQNNQGASVNLTVNSNQTSKLVKAFQYHSFADQLPQAHSQSKSCKRQEDTGNQARVTEPAFGNDANVSADESVNVEHIKSFY